MYCCRHRQFCRRRNWRNTSRADRAGCCRRSLQSCGKGTGDSTCGRGAISARRWARWTRRRSRPILKTKSGTKTKRASRSQRPPSLEPALSRSSLQTASAVLRLSVAKDSTGFQPVVFKRSERSITNVALHLTFNRCGKGRHFRAFLRQSEKTTEQLRCPR
jgi:hypothetical protein